MKIQKAMVTGVMTLSLLATSALPMTALAQNDDMPTIRTAPVIDAACMKSAISKRETSLISAIDAFNASIKAAHQTRQSALMSAWDKTERKDRRKAQSEARKAFRDSGKTARETLRAARKTAWETFGSDAKNCGAKAGNEEGSAREDQNATI